MTTADVNWMLGATVQSGAALVAIVGGLLGSRYVALDAEQQSARRRLAQVESRLESAQAQSNKAREELAEFRVQDLLDKWQCYEAILQGEGDLQLEEFLPDEQLNGRDVSRDRLEAHLGVLREEVQLAFTTLKDLVVDSDLDEDWRSFRHRHEISARSDHAWEWVYGEVVERQERERHEREQQRLAVTNLVRIPVTYLPKRFSNSTEVGTAKTLAADTFNRLVAARDSVAAEVAQLEGEQRAAASHVGEVAQPDGFGLTLSVLTYIGVVSIALPTALMVSGSMTLPLWVRIAVAILFLSGVALLLRYLYVYAAYLGDRSRRESLPRSLLGLLRFPSSGR